MIVSSNRINQTILDQKLQEIGTDFLMAAKLREQESIDDAQTVFLILELLDQWNSTIGGIAHASST